MAVQPLLAELALRCGQEGEADSLAYFLFAPSNLNKIPHLLLFDEPGSFDEPGASGQPFAAVLVFEYKAGWLGSRVLSTVDMTGRRTVFAPRGMRAQISALAAQALVEQGAQIVHLVFSETHSSLVTYSSSNAPRSAKIKLLSDEELQVPDADYAAPRIEREFQHEGIGRPVDWTFGQRKVPVYLPLFPTFDETLARIGRRTRLNLRYYRKRCEADLGGRFVPTVEMSLEEFLAFNRECMYAVPDKLAAWRYEAIESMAGGVIRGVRDGQGRWLSLVGLRRQNRYVEIDWQMNRDGLQVRSLSTVMRSYLIEHEITLGSTRLYMEGGTHQPIGGSFLEERLGELTLKRRTLYARLLERFAQKFLPSENYLAQTLANPSRQWRRWGSDPRTPDAG